jgi:hypothetical protein
VCVNIKGVISMLDAVDQKVSHDDTTFCSVCPVLGQQKKHVDKRVYEYVTSAFRLLPDLFYDVMHKVVGRLVLPAQLSFLFAGSNIFSAKENLKKSNGGKEVYFRNEDGIKLHGMHFQGKGSEDSDRTVIIFNGNGVCYEQYGGSMLFDIGSWQQQGWNVLLFNYRGVGTCEGRATRDGLIADGDAALHYIKDSMDVSEDKILLHGHSLGGGISSEVAALHPQVNYCNDRSFSSLSNAGREMFGGGIIGKVVKGLLIFFGWEYNSRDNWDKIKGKKIALYCSNDSVIKSSARFHETLPTNDTVIEMQGSEWEKSGKYDHMRPLSYKEKEAYFNAINTI